MIALILLTFVPYMLDAYILPKLLLAAGLVFVSLLKDKEMRRTDLWSPALLCHSIVLLSYFITPFHDGMTGVPMQRFTAVLPFTILLLALRVKRWDLKYLPHAAVALSLYGLSQLVYPFLGGYELQGGRITSTIGSPPMLGCVLAMLICLVRPQVALIVAPALLATGSRAAILGAMAGLAYKWGAQGKGVKPVAVLASIGALIVAYIGYKRGVGDSMRLVTWTTALKVWAYHPIFGCGPENFLDAARQFRNPEWIRLAGQRVFSENAHNDWLQVLASFGLVGAAAYAWLHVRVYRVITACAWGENNPGYAAAVIALFVYAKFNPAPWVALFLATILLSEMADFGGTEVRAWHDYAYAGFVFMAFTTVTLSDLMFATGIRRLNRGDESGMTYLGYACSISATQRYYAETATYFVKRWEENGKVYFLKRALEIAESDVKQYPGSAQARQIHASILVILSKSDKRFAAAAEQSVAKAQKLDPSLNRKEN